MTSESRLLYIVIILILLGAYYLSNSKSYKLGLARGEVSFLKADRFPSALPEEN